MAHWNGAYKGPQYPDQLVPDRFDDLLWYGEEALLHRTFNLDRPSAADTENQLAKLRAKVATAVPPIVITPGELYAALPEYLAGTSEGAYDVEAGLERFEAWAAEQNQPGNQAN